MTEEQPQDFAAFEASLAEPDTPADKPEPDSNVNDAKPDDEVLELGEDDELAPDEGEEAKPEGEKRHKTAKQRIDELTKARREAERQNGELLQRIAALEGGHKPDAPELKAPDPEEFEFGEADPAYLEALTDYKVDKKLAERDQKAAEQGQQTQARETFQNLDSNWIEAEARGAEKYDDFADRVEDFKANAPCPPLMAIAIQASPVAEDVTYHLAINQDTAELIAAELAGGDLLGAAKRLGEVEGQYFETKPERPATNAHPADHALYAGRLKAFLAKKPKGKTVTDAPEPPKHQVRGSGGKFSKDPSEMNFAEFEASVNSKK